MPPRGKTRGFTRLGSNFLEGLRIFSLEDDEYDRPARPLNGRRATAPQWGSSSRGASAAQRHNVARLPELDYFVSKLDQTEDCGPGPQWGLPYAKAGQATGLPHADFSSLAAYLDAMQAGAALEFQASIKQALDQAEREKRFTGKDGFFTFVPQKGSGGGGSSSATTGTWILADACGPDFEEDSWGKHLVEVEETRSFHVAVMAKKDEETEEQVLVVLPTIEHDYRGSVRIRSLGYIGPFLAQYSSAQDLRYEDLHGTVPAPTRALLSSVVKPSKWRTWVQQGAGTLLSASAGSLCTDVVPINASQQRAVLGLWGGLDVIHGPPGTGKSTTIYHICSARVQQDAQVLVTCTRNKAVDAVVDKVAQLEGGILVFGNPKRLGEQAAKFTIDGRVEAHSAVAAWKQNLDVLKQLEKQLQPGGGLFYASAYTRESKVVDVLRRVQDRAASATLMLSDMEEEVASVLDQVLQDYYENSAEIEEVVGGLISAIANEGLPILRAHVKAELLQDTRVFVCTIDSTARMAADLAELQVSLCLDTIIVDEAGCVLESALPLLLRLHRSNLVLIGDHKQLQAFTSLLDPPDNHCRSLMERCVDAGMPATLLDVQYRMAPAICAAISAAFYQGALRSGSGMQAPRPCHPACRLVDISGREEQHTGAGFSNREEALRVLAEAEAAARTLVAKGAVQRGVSSTSGGSKAPRPSLFIITLYNKQRGLILDLLEQEGSGARLRTAGWEVAVLSADACQGSEADAVVLSTVRNVTASKTSGAPLSRFFNDRRRINVALSRARHLCVVVGSAATMRQAAVREPFWRTLLQHYSSSSL